MQSSDNYPTAITVADFLNNAPSDLELQLLAGYEGLGERKITIPRLQKLGLALAGFSHYIHPGRLQIVGQSEVRYLSDLSPYQRAEAISNLALEKIACILITKALMPPAEFLKAADLADLPVLSTPVVSSIAITVVTEFLQDRLALRGTVHGDLLDLYGLGVLIEGASGIGKSECALDLISRGHRLVSDDVVEIRRIGNDRLVGSAPALLKEHLEIRGLGIINIRDLFGVSAISAEKAIDVSIQLRRWETTAEVDRLGIDAQEVEILGVKVPHVLIPVSPGRNLSTLVETAVRVHLLRRRGYDAAQSFVARHSEILMAAEDGFEEVLNRDEGHAAHEQKETGRSDD